MERNCEKCVYHTSGFCSKWKCEGTKTRKDIENEAYNKGKADAIDEFYAKCREKYWYSSDFMNFFDEIREQLKENKNE